MAKAGTLSSPFEQSFMFHMIRDFFLLLVLVATVEMGIRYAVVRYDFASKEQARVDLAAQQLANDVKSIMLNSGGPLAAQTVYPILNRNYDDMGLSIAVIPADVTVASMKQFCLNCHVKAKVGDVLGTVKVGSYLERKESAWWTEVRLTAGALSLKILLHTILLFFLLKVRMAPLLSLRNTVSKLARGLMDLTPRAKVNGADEFGELAQDLNHFLDRINVVVTDLDQILNKVVDASGRLSSLNRDLEQTVDSLREAPSGTADTPIEGQAAKYRALAQTLREMALLETNMQNIAQSGQQVLHRLTHVETQK
jgi:methyl-accepting chemotaxis protein